MPISDTISDADDTAVAEGRAALMDLHRRSVDTLRGFQKMVEKASPEFRSVAGRFHAMHARHVSRLDTMVREMGGVPDADGSLMGTVNRVVVGLRATFDGIDAGVMDQVRNGEQHIMRLFDVAIATSLDKGHLQALGEMRVELTRILDEFRHLD